MLDILMSATDRACQELLELAPCDLHLLADFASFVDFDLLVLVAPAAALPCPPPPLPPLALHVCFCTKAELAHAPIL